MVGCGAAGGRPGLESRVSRCVRGAVPFCNQPVSTIGLIKAASVEGLTYNGRFGRLEGWRRHFGRSLHRSALDKEKRQEFVSFLCLWSSSGAEPASVPIIRKRVCIPVEIDIERSAAVGLVRAWLGFCQSLNARFRPLRILRVGRTGSRQFTFGSGCETASRSGRTSTIWIVKRRRRWVSGQGRWGHVFLAVGSSTWGKTRQGRQQQQEHTVSGPD